MFQKQMKKNWKKELSSLVIKLFLKLFHNFELDDLSLSHCNCCNLQYSRDMKMLFYWSDIQVTQI